MDQSKESTTPEVDDANNDEGSWTSLDSFLEYLKSKEGNTVVNRLIGFIEDYNKKKIEQERETALLKKGMATRFFWMRLVLLIICIIAVTFLISYRKFDSTPAIFFTAIVAYLFGKEPK